MSQNAFLLTCIAALMSQRLTNGENIGCFVEGECLRSPYISADETESSLDCLLYCQVDTITVYPRLRLTAST